MNTTKSKSYLMFNRKAAKKGETWWLYATPHMLFRGEQFSTRGVHIECVLIRGVTHSAMKSPLPTLQPGEQIALRVVALGNGDISVKLNGTTIGDAGAVEIDVTTYADRLVQASAPGEALAADDKAMIWKQGGVAFIEHEGGILVVLMTGNGNWSMTIEARDVTDALLALAQRFPTAAVAISAWVQKRLTEIVPIERGS